MNLTEFSCLTVSTRTGKNYFNLKPSININLIPSLNNARNDTGVFKKKIFKIGQLLVLTYNFISKFTYFQVVTSNWMVHCYWSHAIVPFKLNATIAWDQ